MSECYLTGEVSMADRKALCRAYKKNIRMILRFLPMASLSVLLSIYLARGGLVSIKEHLEVASNYSWLTVLILCVLYLIKSISFGIPFAFLYATSGSIFPLHIALLVNLGGIFINMQIPYMIGWRSGAPLVNRVLHKYPQLNRLKNIGSRSGLFIAFLFKFFGKIPHELTNTVLGALHINYWEYIVGSVLGLIPTMVVTTIIGKTASEGAFVTMIISIVALVLLTVSSFIIYKRQISARKKRDVVETEVL